MQQPSQRQLRVAEQVRHVISETLLRGHFHTVGLLNAGPTLSISEVRISPDLKNATAYVSSLKNENIDELIAMLNEEHYVFQKDVASQVRMKFTPRIRFKYDESQERVNRLEALFHNLPVSQNNEDE